MTKPMHTVGKCHFVGVGSVARRTTVVRGRLTPNTVANRPRAAKPPPTPSRLVLLDALAGTHAGAASASRHPTDAGRPTAPQAPARAPVTAAAGAPDAAPAAHGPRPAAPARADEPSSAARRQAGGRHRAATETDSGGRRPRRPATAAQSGRSSSLSSSDQIRPIRPRMWTNSVSPMARTSLGIEPSVPTRRHPIGARRSTSDQRSRSRKRASARTASAAWGPA